MKLQTYLFFVSLFFALTVGQANEAALTGLTDWYVDAINGDDIDGIGSVQKPFKSINAVLSVNKVFPGFVGPGDTIHLAAGEYSTKRALIDIPELTIEGTSNDGLPASILSDVEITADGVTLTNCLFLDARLTLRGVEAVTITKNLFTGKTKDCLVLIGSSNNSFRENFFESATESCVVISFDSKSKQSSSDNLFQENYFTHNQEGTTRQVILSNKNDFFSKKRVNTRNRFINCAFEETISGRLKHVIVDHSKWRTVEDYGPSLIFEDCYFKKADRRVPFIFYIIVNEHSNPDWYWDELINDTWVASNDGDLLTGHKKNEYTPSIQFLDGNGDGLILETEYPFNSKYFVGMLLSGRANGAPFVVNAIADIAVYQDAPSDTINLFDVFEDTVTVDENLYFSVSCDNTSLVSSELEGGLLTLNYAEGAVGMALISVTATDGDSVDPQFAKDSFYVVIVEEADLSPSERVDWFVDSKKGNDESGTGSKSNPFRTIERVFAVYADQPDLESAGRTIHLGEGKYGSVALEINIPGLSIEGTLDKDGKPLTLLEETRITANEVRLVNCKFQDVSLTLLGVENVVISNNVFSGKTDISLYLLGASKNTIQYNEFSSAIHDCVQIYWDLESRKSSNDNLFLRNYFTHRAEGSTNRAIRVKWSAGYNDSISARNRFVECAFEETKPGQLLQIIDDDCNWWMVADYQYSVAFEDCYFKRADRTDPFSEFVILEGYPDFKWRWDELINDKWISSNTQLAITGDHNGWNHRPRIQFVDKDGNGNTLEIVHNAGLLPVGDNDTK